MTLQDLSVYIIVAAAAAYVLRTFYAQLSVRDDHKCPGCGHCDPSELISPKLVTIEAENALLGKNEGTRAISDRQRDD